MLLRYLACEVVLVLTTAALPAEDAPGGNERAVPISPVAPEETLSLFHLHPDCRIELVAAEPDVIDPVHVAFDPDGRMWVVEYSDYPNGPGEGQPGLSRIRILTDDDGDGRYANAQVFADKLLFANGLTFWRDGVIVTLEGAVEFMRDTDGDGRADERLELFTGFTPENPQLRANHPTFALDNHIYIANGLRGGTVVAGKDWHQFFSQPSTHNPEPVSLSGRDFRFDPLTGAFEAVSGMGQFGMSFDDWGNRFVCSNRNPCDHVVLEDWYLKRNPNLAVPRVMEQVSPAAENSRIYPISRFWTTSNLHAGQFTAACGICLYRGNALPDSFYGNSFVCDPTGNLVHCDVLEPKGATFTSHYLMDGVEFLASTDEWFRPVNLTIGPDGALYVVDMYRAVIEHPQFVPDELKARPDLMLGNDRGRIYRIVAKDAPQESDNPRPQLSQATTGELIDLLRHDNAWQRESAHRMLLERQAPEDADALKLLLMTSDRPLEELHGYSLIAALGSLDTQTAAWGLSQENSRVAGFVAMLAARHGLDDPTIQNRIDTLTERTKDSRLQFELLIAVGQLGGNQQLASRVVCDRLDDSWIAYVAAASVSQPERLFESIIAVLKNQDDPTRIRAIPVLELFAGLAAKSTDTASLERLLQEIDRINDYRDQPQHSPSQSLQLTAFVVFAEAFQQNGHDVRSLMRRTSTHGPVFIAEDIALSRLRGFNDRLLAIRALKFDPWDYGSRALPELIQEPDQELAVAVVESLSFRSTPDPTTILLSSYPKQSPTVRRAIITALLANSERISALLDEIEAGRISPREIDPARADQLRNHADSAIRERAQALPVDTTAADRQKVIADYQPSLTLESDPERGRALFIKNCQQCHKIGDTGVNVAPDISDSRTKTHGQLLVSILDPNRAIDNNYFSYTVLDNDGVVYTGVIAAETATSVTLRQAEGKELTLLRTDIDELKNNGVSLMPVGLEKDIDLQQMADLISFIKNWRYLDGSVPPEVIR